MVTDPLVTTADAAALRRLSVQLAPSSVYMRSDDSLRVTSYNSLAAVTLNIRSRFVTLEGTIVASADPLVPNTDRTAKAAILPTPEGWLLGGEVFVSGAAPLIGQTFVVVEVVRGLVAASATPLQVIAAGYVTAKIPLTFPGVIRSSLEGPGAVRSILGTDPAAGIEITETVPTGARWRFISLMATLVCDATVANRTPSFLFDDGANVFVQAIYTATIAASGQVVAYLGHHGLNTAPNGVGHFAVPNDALILGAGFRVRSSVSGLQAGDNWGAPKYLIEEWIEGA